MSNDGSDINFTLDCPLLNLEKPLCDRKRLLVVYSLERTDCPAHALNNHIIIEGTLNNYRRDLTIAVLDIVLELAVPYWMLSQQLMVFDWNNPRTKQSSQ